MTVPTKPSIIGPYTFALAPMRGAPTGPLDAAPAGTRATPLEVPIVRGTLRRRGAESA